MNLKSSSCNDHYWYLTSLTPVTANRDRLRWIVGPAFGGVGTRFFFFFRKSVALGLLSASRKTGRATMSRSRHLRTILLWIRTVSCIYSNWLGRCGRRSSCGKPPDGFSRVAEDSRMLCETQRLVGLDGACRRVGRG